MFRDEKHLKDSSNDLGISVKDNSFSVSYTKTDKLITALYMVTDVIEKDEPLRNKLRTLGVEILSDMHSIQQNNVGYSMSFIGHKISELMSFLNIAADLNIISEMNCNILRKEFSELNQAIKNSVSNIGVLNRQVDLTEFFKEPTLEGWPKPGVNNFIPPTPKGHASGHPSTNIGVQNKNTLLKTLKQIETSYAKINHSPDVSDAGFDALKKQRRDGIVAIIKTIDGGATIKDIKDKAKTSPEKFSAIISCSEKTMQRELVSMVKDNVLEKMGEKRWSKYFLKLS
jgi:hypothetical protein